MSKIAIALEGLHFSEHSLALSAYTLIENLTKTQHEICLITSRQDSSHSAYNFSNVEILQPIKKWNGFSSLRILPPLYNLSPDALLIMAPFSSSNSSEFNHLLNFSRVAKIFLNTKTFFMGYDPSFHQWPKSLLKTIDAEFDINFDSFYGHFTKSVTLPFITPHLSIRLSDSSSQKLLLINGSFCQLKTHPNILNAIEDFLFENSHWKVLVLKGWGKTHKFHQLSQQVTWQEAHQAQQWIISDECMRSSLNHLNCSAILDILPYISDSYMWLNSACAQGVPIVSLSHQYKPHLSSLIVKNQNVYIIKDDGASLYEKLLILNDTSSHSHPASNLQNADIDCCINIFNRTLSAEIAK